MGAIKVLFCVIIIYHRTSQKTDQVPNLNAFSRSITQKNENIFWKSLRVLMELHVNKTGVIKGLPFFTRPHT